MEARRLGGLRDHWPNPPEWVDEPVPGYPKRPVPCDEDTAKALKKRTLTNLYNACRSGFAGSGLPMRTKPLTRLCEVLRELLALNGGWR